MRNNNAGCLSALLPAFSRMMLLMYWISRPVQMNLAFNTFILPCLGFMFLPFTTLMYVWLVQGIGGIQGIDWLWLILAVLLDVSSIAGAAAANRDRLPGGNTGTTTTP